MSLLPHQSVFALLLPSALRFHFLNLLPGFDVWTLLTQNWYFVFGLVFKNGLPIIERESRMVVTKGLGEGEKGELLF